MSIMPKPAIMQTAILVLPLAIAQPAMTATPTIPSQPGVFGAVSHQPLSSRSLNPLWTARRTTVESRASTLLSGLAPGAAVISAIACGGCNGALLAGSAVVAGAVTATAIAGGSHLRRFLRSSSESGTIGKIRDFFRNLVVRSDSKRGGNTQTITFVYVNDIHDRFTPEANGDNPLARMRGFYEQVRDENEHTIFVDGGDIHEKGDITALITRGLTTRAAFEAVGFDLSTFGNHDFAWSAEDFLAFSRTPKTVMLGSNITYVGDNPAEYGGVEYHVREVGGVRIGFFGMVSKGYDERDEQTDKDYYPGILKTRHDYDVRARELIDKLRNNQHVDVVVMVSHLGIDEDRNLAKSVKGIDVILSAHSHDAIKEVVNGVPIIQADAYSRLIGRLDIVWDLDEGRIVDHSMKLIKNDSSVQTDETVADEINGIVHDHMPKDNFAQLERKLGDKEAIAWLAGKAAIYHLNHLPDGQSMNVDAALVDQKTVWQEDWKPGTITLNQLARTFEVEREPSGTPGFSSFYTIKVTGEELNLMRVEGLIDKRWVYIGESDPQPDRTYTLALPKKAAWNLEHYLNISERESKPACEIWEAVYAYGLHRTEQGFYIDDDRPLEHTQSD